MEDVTMQDGEASLFTGLTFIIIPNGLSETRLKQVYQRVPINSNSANIYIP